MTKTKEKSQVEEKNVEVVEEESSPWLYFYTVGCGFCKKAEPIVDELNASGKYPEILKLDLKDPDNRGLNNELKQKYNTSCGTPWFINAETGQQICGYREKDIVETWLKGEEIPVPPRPKGPMPKPPLMGCPKEEEEKWIEDYGKWAKENEHLPKLQTAEEILARPRPKTEPPKPPAPNSTDEQFAEWVEKYDTWKSENEHLPNLQPGSTIVERFKQQAAQQGMPPGGAGAMDPSVAARIQRLEQKMDKIIKHFGVK